MKKIIIQRIVHLVIGYVYIHLKSVVNSFREEDKYIKFNFRPSNVCVFCFSQIIAIFFRHLLCFCSAQLSSALGYILHDYSIRNFIILNCDGHINEIPSSSSSSFFQFNDFKLGLMLMVFGCRRPGPTITRKYNFISLVYVLVRWLNEKEKTEQTFCKK